MMDMRMIMALRMCFAVAVVIMSGSTPQCSMPHMVDPVRPKPVWTSSQMKIPPYFLMMPTASLSASEFLVSKRIEAVRDPSTR